jgi:16S rRNA processing protein RimM
MGSIDVALTGKDAVILGRISGLFGVKGWFKVHSYTEPRDAILNYKNWLIGDNGEWKVAKLEEGKRHSKTVIARLEGVSDRETAAGYVGAEIGVNREAMPDLKSGDFYWTDLEGLNVVHKDGRALGEVKYLLATGSNDVLVVQGDREILVPFIKDEVIEDVDLAAGVIRVDWEWD